MESRSQRRRKLYEQRVVQRCAIVVLGHSLMYEEPCRSRVFQPQGHYTNRGCWPVVAARCLFIALGRSAVSSWHGAASPIQQRLKAASDRSRCGAMMKNLSSSNYKPEEPVICGVTAVTPWQY